MKASIDGNHWRTQKLFDDVEAQVKAWVKRVEAHGRQAGRKPKSELEPFLLLLSWLDGIEQALTGILDVMHIGVSPLPIRIAFANKG